MDKFTSASSSQGKGDDHDLCFGGGIRMNWSLGGRDGIPARGRYMGLKPPPARKLSVMSK